MEWATTSRDGALVARPSGKIDEASWQLFADALIAAVRAAAAAGQPLVVDLSAVHYMSSRGLRALTRARQGAGTAVAVVRAGPNPRVREILAISRYDKIFRVTDAVGQE